VKIGWNIKANNELASFRYRTNIPINILKKLGYNVGYGVGDITIFQKHFYPPDIELAKNLKNNGKKVIFDICDNHFEGQFKNYYIQMCEIADAVTCSTNGLKEVIKGYTGKDPIIILDSYEFEESSPEIPSGKVKNVLWYGSSTNIEPVMKTSFPYINLRLVSDALIIPKNTSIPNKSDSVKWEHNGTSLEFVRWRHEEMPKHFKWCDIVVIPVFNSLKYYVKGGNRMFESIRQGRFVVANYIPEYINYEMWVGDIKEGISWVNNNVEEAINRIKKGQEIVKVKHDPVTLSKMWVEIANKLLGE
jgi:hypothetical protein